LAVATVMKRSAATPAGYWTLILVASSMGALTVVSEYSSGLIRTTTVAIPARGSVVLAKTAVTAALWTAVGTAASTGSFMVSRAILNGPHAGLPLTHPGVFRALAASALLAPVCALVGLGLGVLLRHTAATMATSVFTLVMLPPMFSESSRWSADLKHALVSTAWNRLIQSGAPSRDPWAAPRHGPRLLDRVRTLAADHGHTRRSRRQATRRVKYPWEGDPGRGAGIRGGPALPVALVEPCAGTVPQGLRCRD
jgi:hypothetical protein